LVKNHQGSGPIYSRIQSSHARGLVAAMIQMRHMKFICGVAVAFDGGGTVKQKNFNK